MNKMLVNQYFGQFYINTDSFHYDLERRMRNKNVQSLEKGHIVSGFYVDRGHPKGPELHWVLSNGVIVIVNAKTKKHVTSLIARPGQVSRYYKACNMQCPIWLLNICREHQIQGLNHDGCRKEKGYDA